MWSKAAEGHPRAPPRISEGQFFECSVESFSIFRGLYHQARFGAVTKYSPTICLFYHVNTKSHKKLSATGHGRDFQLPAVLDYP